MLFVGENIRLRRRDRRIGLEFPSCPFSSLRTTVCSFGAMIETELAGARQSRPYDILLVKTDLPFTTLTSEW